MKLFSGLTSLLMLSMLLGACGSDADATSIDTINVEIDGVVSERQVVKLAAVDMRDSWLPMAVAGFNENSEKYHVVVNYYVDRNIRVNSLAEYDELVDEAMAQFNIDVAAGNVPDIFMAIDNIQTNSYINKRLFADLNEFMNNDPDFDRADYLPSLFETFDRNGKMYEITPLVWINAIQAKTVDVGSDAGWTLDEFAAFIETKPDAECILGDLTKRDFIIKMTQYLFIDPITGEIKYDRDEFQKILKVAERFPADLPHGDDKFRTYGELMLGAKDGNPLMLPIRVDSFFLPSYWEKLYFGEEVTIKGWPSPAGNGIRFSPTAYFSILQPAKNSKGAWEFLKYALNNAKCKYRGLLPMNLSLLDEMVEFDYNAWEELDNRDLAINETDVDKIMALLKSASSLDRENRAIGKIIDEEIGPYLNGQKPADTVTGIIENRIALYLTEQK